ncbi:hypothetical protein [Bradyrhizobium sp. STM 3557]|uniref:hypothetical protein n=1 Tax=Bradyrhizobium sp. STM 3557 TaxID=578920 RepID=UPI00388D1EA3
MSEAPKQHRAGTIATVIGIALVCIVALVFLVRDRWHSPELKSAEQARSSITGKVARAAGAIVLPTDPKLTVEPKPAGPKPAQPAIPN